MRYVIALGGNALLQRGEPPDAGIQRHHVRAAAEALAPVIAAHDLVICHGNGPQIGVLAAESENDPELSAPYPLDLLGAQTQGMIGYWLTQELTNAGVTRPVAVVLTQTLVAADDPAFERPTKFIGRTYSREQALTLAGEREWHVAEDGAAWRRVVASPEPRRVLELDTVRALTRTGVTVVCAGGGGAPVIHDGGGLRGVDAVVDKDLTAAQLAVDLDADVLVLLTDVPGVLTGFGTPQAAVVPVLHADEHDAGAFPAGSMGPKVAACARFAARTGRPARIGALADAAAVIAGTAGTTVRSGHAPAGTTERTRP